MSLAEALLTALSCCFEYVQCNALAREDTGEGPTVFCALIMVLLLYLLHTVPGKCVGGQRK